MEAHELQEITTALKESKPVAVRLYDGIKIYLIEDFPERKCFKAKFLPCAKNSRDYEITYEEIKERVS